MSEIAQIMGLAKGSVNNLIHGGVETGVLHPLVGRGRTHLLLPEEANLVIAKKVPYIQTLERREQMETRLEQIYPNIQIPPIAEELWHKVKSGDQQAFSILLGFYEPIIAQEANNPVFGMTKEERLIILYTGFYEIIMESNMFPSNGKVIGTLREKLKQRKREEAHSWFSLDERLSTESTDTFLDFLDAEGRLWLR